jgi:hypothetical protein
MQRARWGEATSVHVHHGGWHIQQTTRRMRWVMAEVHQHQLLVVGRIGLHLQTLLAQGTDQVRCSSDLSNQPFAACLFVVASPHHSLLLRCHYTAGVGVGFRMGPGTGCADAAGEYEDDDLVTATHSTRTNKTGQGQGQGQAPLQSRPSFSGLGTVRERSLPTSTVFAARSL